DVNGNPCATTPTSPCSVPLGSSVNDSATLTGANPGTGSPGTGAGGTVTYSLFPNGTCTAPATSTQTVTVTDANVPNSTPFTPTAGSYSYQASYSGDAQDVAPPPSACEPFNVGKSPTTTATTVFDASTNAALTGNEQAGTSVYDTSSVSGQQDGIVPTGTV